MKKIRPLALGKLQAIVMAFVGLLAGVAYSVGGAIYDALTASLNTGSALAFLALLGMPLMFGAVGFVAGILEAQLYNLISAWVGGIELDMET